MSAIIIFSLWFIVYLLVLKICLRPSDRNEIAILSTIFLFWLFCFAYRSMHQIGFYRRPGNKFQSLLLWADIIRTKSKTPKLRHFWVSDWSRTSDPVTNRYSVKHDKLMCKSIISGKLMFKQINIQAPQSGKLPSRQTSRLKKLAF